MTPIADIIANARRTDAGFTATIPADWMQGRTSYGGLTAALALHAALGIADDLPPLRSAQVSFIGPLAGDVTVSATQLRRGRNAAFVQADVSGEKGLGLRATFVFMAELESKAALSETPPAPIGPPDGDANIYTGPDDFFAGNFNFVDHKDGLGDAEWLRWGRLRGRDGLHPMVELMAVGDGLPPAAMKLFEKMVPVSSLSWIINFLDPEPATQDGWWLLHSESNHALGGYSSQSMHIWNSDGKMVAEAMQGVAIFA